MTIDSRMVKFSGSAYNQEGEGDPCVVCSDTLMTRMVLWMDVQTKEQIVFLIY